jgi:hypothetical protein
VASYLLLRAVPSRQVTDSGRPFAPELLRLPARLARWLEVIAILLRVAWRSVSDIVARVVAERAGQTDRLAGLRRIGIDALGADRKDVRSMQPVHPAPQPNPNSIHTGDHDRHCLPVAPGNARYPDERSRSALGRF